MSFKKIFFVACFRCFLLLFFFGGGGGGGRDMELLTPDMHMYEQVQ